MIRVRKSPSADSTMTIYELARATECHIKDVRKAMEFFRAKMYDAMVCHDQHQNPNDADLIGILETLCDCVVAKMAQDGEYMDEDVPSPDILVKAYENTARILVEQIRIVEDKQR